MRGVIKQLLVLNLATLLIGTSGPLGRHIALPADYNIFIRCLIAGIALYLLCKFQKQPLRIQSKQDLIKLVLSGCFLCIHWVTYFIALKISSVAIGMISMFSFPMITTLLEPFFFKTRLNWVALINSILVLVGIYFLVPEFSLENDSTQGVIWGVTSAFFYSLRNLLNKGLVKRYNGGVIMFYQVSISAILLSYTLFVGYVTTPTNQDWLLLITLGILTTAIGHTLFVKSLRHFSTSTASIISSTQPIYGIILAAIFLSEIVNGSVFIGGTLILSTVVIQGVVEYKLSSSKDS